MKLEFVNSGVREEELLGFQEKISEIQKVLEEKAGDEKEFLGWMHLPTGYDKEEFDRIKKAAKRIQETSDIFVVIGIGGSYLGSRAVINGLKGSFFDLQGKVLYAGTNISPNYLNDLLAFIEGKDISINVISKSGTTTEPGIAFRVLKEVLEKKYGKEEAKKRIYVTTDKQKGGLKKLSDEEGYETFVVPDNVGGRYSVLTAVGLLPCAVAGIDIDKLMKGARDAQQKYSNLNLAENDCYQYAVLRNLLYRQEKNIEILVQYEPSMHFFTEWWKQLYGESEGKEKKGIFPAGVQNTTDLHSMGQYIQDGRRNLFETVVKIEHSNSDIIIKEDKDNVDGLNFLAGKGMDYINQKAMEGTIAAHVMGNVPNILLSVERLDEACMGELIYFFEKACAISGYLLGVNPFDQPGVEEYKKNMFRLLGKEGV